MNKKNSNLYIKVIRKIIEKGVSSPHFIAQSLEISEELLNVVINSLLEKGYLNYIDDKEFKKEASFHCKFCPYAKDCSENLPSVFYELSEKGKNITKNYNN